MDTLKIPSPTPKFDPSFPNESCLRTNCYSPQKIFNSNLSPSSVETCTTDNSILKEYGSQRSLFISSDFSSKLAELNEKNLNSMKYGKSNNLVSLGSSVLKSVGRISLSPTRRRLKPVSKKALKNFVIKVAHTNRHASKLADGFSMPFKLGYDTFLMRKTKK